MMKLISLPCTALIVVHVCCLNSVFVLCIYIPVSVSGVVVAFYIFSCKWTNENEFFVD